MDEYISVSENSITEIVEKKSKFIAHTAHIETEEEAVSFINAVKKEHYNATHNVFAYILKNGKKKYSDDGEPSKTAGFPILDMMEKELLTDVVCVVTRYFGGTLLGTGGLIRAYTASAKEGIMASKIAKKSLCDILKITTDYAFLDKIKYILKSKPVIIEDIEYLEKATFKVVSPIEFTKSTIDSLVLELGISIDIKTDCQMYCNLPKDMPKD